MLKIFIFIFLGLITDIDNVYSQFFMPQGALSDTTSVSNIKPVSRISNNSKSMYKSKKIFSTQKQPKKQKSVRKLFMAIKTEEQKQDNAYIEAEQINKVSEKNVDNKSNNSVVFHEKELTILNQEKPMIKERTKNSTNNIFDIIESEYKEDLIDIGNGTYKGNSRIDRVLSDFRDKDHRI